MGAEYQGGGRGRYKHIGGDPLRGVWAGQRQRGGRALLRVWQAAGPPAGAVRGGARDGPRRGRLQRRHRGR
eukprot:2100806-Pyramimonas_sp.AAC.1